MQKEKCDGFLICKNDDGSCSCYKKSNHNRFHIYFAIDNEYEGVSGLAHFVEHLIPLSLENDKDSGDIDLSGISASTGANNIVFKYELNGELNEEEDFLDEEDDDEDERQCVYEDNEEDELIVSTQEKLKNALNIFSKNLYVQNYSQEQFEIEKKVIDKENLYYYTKPIENNVDSFKKYINNISKECKVGILQNMGNFNSLKDVTMEQVADYNKKFFIKENLVFVLESPFEFEYFENIIKKSFIDKLISNKDAKVKFDKVKVLNNPKYYFFNERLDYAVKVCPIISNNVNNLNVSELIIAFDMINHFSSNSNGSLENITSALRRKGIIYSVEECELFDNGSNVFYIYQYTTNSYDLKESLITVAEFVKEAIEYYQDNENIENYKNTIEDLMYAEGKYLYNVTIDDAFDMVKDNQNYISMQEKENALRYCYNLPNQEIKEILKKFQSTLNLSFILTGDIKLEDLPQLQYLQNIAKGYPRSIIMENKSLKDDKNFRNKIYGLECCAEGKLSDIIEKDYLK